MNFRCLFKGHLYKDTCKLVWRTNPKDLYIESCGGLVQRCEYNMFQCKRCLKKKLVFTGNSRIE